MKYHVNATVNRPDDTERDIDDMVFHSTSMLTKWIEWLMVSEDKATSFVITISRGPRHER